MGINVVKKGDEVLLRVDNSSLTGDAAKNFKDEALKVIDAGEIYISLDLSATEYIDSSGVGKILFLNKTIQKLNGTLRVEAISEKLYDFLDSLAITKVMEIKKPGA